MIFYSDIDYVLHDYSIPFLETIKSLYSIDIRDKKKHLMEKKDLISPIEYFISEARLNEKQMELCLRETDKKEDWFPMSFSESIVSFLKQKRKEGHEVRVVTARTDRHVASKMIHKIFGEEIPVFICDRKLKFMVLKDNSYFFEDDADAAINASLFVKGIKIIVPKYPWNELRIKRHLENGAKNLVLCDKEKITELLETKKIEGMFDE